MKQLLYAMNFAIKDLLPSWQDIHDGNAHLCISRMAAHKVTEIAFGLLVQNLFLLLNPTMTLGILVISPVHPQGLSSNLPSTPHLHIFGSKVQQSNQARPALTR